MSNCLICKKEFELKKKNSTQKFCSKNCRDKHYYQGHKEQNKISTKASRQRQIAEGRPRGQGAKTKALYAWMVSLKSQPCTDCKKNYPICCMEFDHVRGKKIHNIGSMFAHTYSRETIELEIAKCELVCANCHKVRTRNRKRGSGKYPKGFTKEQLYIKEYEDKVFKCSPIISSLCWPSKQTLIPSNFPYLHLPNVTELELLLLKE
jgi:endogenous inhibitor of DNA gyrase (YacG/DUF329 family)